MFEPTNEQGTIFVFSIQAEQAGWEVVEIGCHFPDATLKYKGDLWKVEFEYKASNFIFHGHDARECDLIICWENDYKDCPLPIIELRDNEWFALPPEKCQPHQKEIEYWR